ncbi:MAG: excinuclease ABC subunit UvrA [Kiritimatiellae bacterium]|nr:excinuclease ABC subunit UvrA [Kiritimatiellia bacterium]
MPDTFSSGHEPADSQIVIEDACQNTLKHLTLRLPLNRLIAITGVSGSGKSSLAFDTIYAEGQRRYVETFSPYARQFLERMDRPKVARISGIPPAIAIDQSNQVRTSRSTVGTMTELNDYLKLLFARAARLYCRKCHKLVERHTPDSIWEELLRRVGRVGPPNAEMPNPPELLITFPIRVPSTFSEKEIIDLLSRQGYTKIYKKEGGAIEVLQDRVQLRLAKRQRIVEDLETALRHGNGSVYLYLLSPDSESVESWRFSSELFCPDCDIRYVAPTPNDFSFNSPLGACETCRGFGRVIGIDYTLVIPDPTKSLEEGAVKPWQTDSYRECQEDLLRFARKRGIPTKVPWYELSEEQRHWVLEGEGSWEEGVWYGVRRFFEWLETKSYRMHIRVLLSRYRAYRPCPACGGSRLKSNSLLWRLGPNDGLSIHEIMQLPVERCSQFFRDLVLPKPLDEACKILLDEIRSRLRYLVDVGLGYLTLDRQSRTLSGGELQRINLTTALGTSLVNTLFVLDEPSVGLHPRDIHRLVEVLHRLRDAGNTLIVVEHDPHVICAADKILDMGPGPGQSGGEAVYFGSLSGLLKCTRSLTGQYLAGRKKTRTQTLKTPPSSRPAEGPTLVIAGASEHNLKNIDVAIPLHRLVCITGVSGSGKSTLIQDVCHPALLRLKNRPAEPPGRHREIRGHEFIDDVVLVDQTPIGRTARSTPASYIGAFDLIRKVFSEQPLARERGYTPATFGFNSGEGRCPTCHGNGFEHVEMQFLSDVYLRCPDCDGRRYRPEVLEVEIRSGANGRGKSIADVLEMTVEEAADFFAEYKDLRETLDPLLSVGLGYLKLGQPVPTLSGGEAQRLKIASHLTAAETEDTRRHILFLFDEPTTGLHFHDIARLLQTLRELIKKGHSVVVIEHNLDVIAAADWIIDLGPEGGENGGMVVCTGTPVEVAQRTDSHTGVALARHLTGRDMPEYQPLRAHRAQTHRAPPSIFIHGAREHNLRNVDVSILRDKFTVITGVSGSGKSTLAFDILFSEGQRRYLESLSAYARQFVQPIARPDVDSITGIPPTVAIEQRTSRGGLKSTVATVTEVYHFLRLLFAKLGTQFCPDCHVPIQSQTPEAIVARILRDFRNKVVEILAPLVVGRKGYYTELARWAASKGFSLLRLDGHLTDTRNWPRLNRYQEHNIEAPLGQALVTPRNETLLRSLLGRALDLGKGRVLVEPTAQISGKPIASILFSTKRACPRCERSFEDLDPRLFSFNSKHGWCPRCYGTGTISAGRQEINSVEQELESLERSVESQSACPACRGTRLRAEALAVRFSGMSIAEFTGLTIEQAYRRLAGLRLTQREVQIARDVLTEIRTRLGFLERVGLAYLTLDRSVTTLSGGEAQRLRLAAQLGSNLRGVCYILDEPTIGLHPHDNDRLLKTLRELQAKGNTVVVVEHDENTIRHADYVVDLGPGGGIEGGRVVAQGPVPVLLKSAQSVTGRYLRTPLRHPIASKEQLEMRHQRSAWLHVSKAFLHNLRHINVDIPLGRLVCVTGVSGSGKSTLVCEVLYQSLRRLVSRRKKTGGIVSSATAVGCEKILGWEQVHRVLDVDQTPIGKTPRSCPATYVGFWDDIRRLFAETPEARMRGYGPGRFSFNMPGGRCDACAGQGVKCIEMSFLADVTVRCEACEGKRFNHETEEVRFKGKSIADVLQMSVAEAAKFFEAQARISHALHLLEEVGLGYLTLGQPSPSLSGGEAQRIKLVTELVKATTHTGRNSSLHTLYVLDEPTVGLHMADVEKLVKVLHKLVDAGHTVVVIEHNLDVIAEADWIIDLGPEGGEKGGTIVAAGNPEEIARAAPRSHTGRYLSRFLTERSVCRGSIEREPRPR